MRGAASSPCLGQVRLRQTEGRPGREENGGRPLG
jgi:hypothetical protein